MKSKKEKIIIFANAGLGDFIWATSAIDLIKSYDRSLFVILITSQNYKQLIHKNLIDCLVTTNLKYHLNKNVFIRLLYKLLWILKNYFKLYKATTILFLDTSNFMSFCAKYILHIKNIAGPKILWFGKDVRNLDTKYYTNSINLPCDANRTHMIVRYQLLAKNLFPTYNLSVPKLADTNCLVKEIKQKYLQNTKKYKIAFCTQSLSNLKNWSITYFKELIEFINDYVKSNVTFFIVGNSFQENKNAIFLQKDLSNIDIRNLVNKTNLLELKEFLNNIDLLVSVDTGTMHIASVNKTPMISIYSGFSLPEHSMAVNSNNISICTYEKCSPCDGRIKKCMNMKCLKNISPEFVFAKVKELLKK